MCWAPRRRNDNMDIRRTIREWILPVAMVTGASLYLIYDALPEPVHKAGPYLEAVVGTLQPLLIFAMLFLTFCRIEPRDLKPHRWHWWLLLVQGGMFVVLGCLALVVIHFIPGAHDSVALIESAMLCFMCPTATAASVVTRKLGGDVPGITTYIILVNLLTAVLVPLVVPLIQPMAGLNFWEDFCLILAKVLPLLMLPCLCAWLVRYLMPGLHKWFLRQEDLAFNLWVVALTLAIAVTTKAIVNSTLSVSFLLMMSFISLICCALQFAVGRHIGSSYRPRRPLSPEAEARARDIRKVTAGQSLGQKNTVFAIWLGYTFMTPETAIVGGLYSIWHNLYNSWQLGRAQRKS